jgi:hypothetical protein
MRAGTDSGCLRSCLGEVCPGLQADLVGERRAPLAEEESVTRSVDYLGSVLPGGPSA